jgi:ABC-2 type transport system ATP-binding protein
LLVIEVEELTRRFGDVTAVDGLSLTVAEGEVFGLLGPNGAGKTTTVRMVACLISATSGQARIAGRSISDPAAATQIRGLVGLMPEEAGLYGDLTARQNLDFFGRLYRIPKPLRAERSQALLAQLGLWDRRDTPVRAYSKGMRQRLAIARALIHDPPLLLLDEPTANLDPEGARTVREFLLHLRGQGRTIVINTHHLEEADRICDRVGILNTRLVAVGTPDELRRSVWGGSTVVRLDEVTDAVLAAVRGLNPRSLSAATGMLTIGVTDPRRDNPDLVAAIVAAGGRVQTVTEVTPSLEDVYLKIVKGQA